VNVAELFGFLFAALAAGGNAMANVMQRKASLQQPEGRPFGVALLLDLLTRPTWLLGFLGLVASFVLQAVALGLGQLSAVEPVITLEVPLTLLVASRVFRTRLGSSEWSGILVMTAGMILLIASLDPRRGNETTVSSGTYLAAGIGTVATIAALVIAGTRGRVMWRTACLGAAAGTSFGLTATMIKETIAHGQARGVAGILTTWQTYTAVAFGVFGLVIMQWAMHTGPLLAAQPGFTLMDPLVSILWGTLVFNEITRTGGWLVPATLGAVAVGVGIVVLARSPLMGDTVDVERPAHDAGGVRQA
jgi:drug/metabolite transporter (DMT)-like permease